MSGFQRIPVTDPYMAGPGSKMPPLPSPLAVDPQFGNIRLVTPFGRFAYLNIAKPKQVKQPDGSLGAPQFSGTLLLNPDACGDIYRAIVLVASHRFQPEQRPDPNNPNSIVTMTAEQLLFVEPRMGGLHYPLREGEMNYRRDPKRYEPWRPYLFLNASLYATSSKGNAQSVVCKDENGYMCDPTKMMSGDYGRMQLTFFAFPAPGSQGRGARGVGVTLNGIQFAAKGERLGGFDADKSVGDAFAAAGPVEPIVQPQVGYGPNSATPGSVPPGFAPAPQQVQQPPAQAQPNWQPPPAGGGPVNMPGRPPGM